MRTKRNRKAVAAMCSVLFLSVGCDDIPDGLMDLATYAVIGSLMGCPVQKCEAGAMGVPLFAAAGDRALVESAFSQLTQPWCPAWSNAIVPIPANQTAMFSENRRYGFNLVGIGQISVTAEDASATIQAMDPGWKLEIGHPNHLPGNGTCPSSYAALKCVFRPRSQVNSSGEVTISWTLPTGKPSVLTSGSATVSASTVLRHEFGTEITFCTMAQHAGNTSCGGSVHPPPSEELPPASPSPSPTGP